MPFIIVTPERKWLLAAKDVAATNTQGDPSVSGFYRRTNGGILFFGLDGEPFAFLVAHHPHERFFVSCSMTAQGIRYMYSTCSLDEVTLGIDQLGHAAKHDLAQRIMEDLDQHAATSVMVEAGMGVEQLAEMANQPLAVHACRGTAHRAGLVFSATGEVHLTSPGRIMLMRAGFDWTGSSWAKQLPAAA